MKMIWSRLKTMKCPKCNSKLKDVHEYYICSGRGCGFSVNKIKFQEIVNSLYSSKPIFERDNLSELNNLGRSTDILEDTFID